MRERWGGERGGGQGETETEKQTETQSERDRWERERERVNLIGHIGAQRERGKERGGDREGGGTERGGKDRERGRERPGRLYQGTEREGEAFNAQCNRSYQGGKDNYVFATVFCTAVEKSEL